MQRRQVAPYIQCGPVFRKITIRCKFFLSIDTCTIMGRGKLVKKRCVTQAPPPDDVVRMLLSVLPLRMKIRCSLVCREWGQLVHEELSAHLDFKSGEADVPLRGVCTLAVSVPWARISLDPIDLCNTAGLSDDVVGQVLKAVKGWDRSEGLTLDFAHLRVGWEGRRHLMPLMPCVTDLTVGPRSTTAVCWATGLLFLTVRFTQLGPVMDSIPSDLLCISLEFCLMKAITPCCLHQWLGRLHVLREVTIINTNLNMRMLEAVMAAAADGSWDALTLESVGMRAKGAKMVGSAIKRCLDLKRLGINWNPDVGDVGAAAVAAGAVNLRVLEMCACSITSEGAATFMRELCKHPVVLKTLIATGNRDGAAFEVHNTAGIKVFT